MKEDREIGELLELLKEVLIEDKEGFEGMCAVLSLMDKFNIVTTDEYYIIDDYIEAYAKTRKVFYEYCDDGCTIRKTKEKYMFIWVPNNIKPRLKWLDKHIKLNKI